MISDWESDLVVLVPSEPEHQVLQALLTTRRPSLGIRAVRCLGVFVHPRRDAGCYREAPDFLRGFARRAQYALVIFDHHGCGRDAVPAESIAEETEGRLARSGWEGRARVVVVEPELEAWVWSDSPGVADVLGWQGRQPALREWLEDRGLWRRCDPKPHDPKCALKEALDETHGHYPSALYSDLAARVSLNRCIDPAFRRLKATLREWFPA